MATYPSSLLVKADVINDVDVVDQNDHNILKGEIIALQTTIGTNPHGNRNNLADRLNAVMSGSGGFVNVTAVPASTYVGKYWYRTDLETMQVVKSDNTVQSIGGSLSNIIYNSTVFNTDSALNYKCFFNEGTMTPSIAGSALTFWGCSHSNSWLQMRPITRWRKITGITTLVAYIDFWSDGNGGRTTQISFGIGATTDVSSSSAGSTVGTDILSIDVSGLNVGTYYDIVFKAIASGAGGNKTYLGNHAIIGA